MMPCCVTGIRTQVDLSSANEVQLSVTGMVLRPAAVDLTSLQEPVELGAGGEHGVGSASDHSVTTPSELPSPLEAYEEEEFSTGVSTGVSSPLSPRSRATSPLSSLVPEPSLMQVCAAL